VGGAQQRLTFASYEAAKEFAKAAVREIAQNRSNFITLRGPQAYDYQQAVGLLSPAGLSDRDGTNIVVESLRLLAGDTGILDAVKYHGDTRPLKSALAEFPFFVLPRLREPKM
jgi:hypothetical protein